MLLSRSTISLIFPVLFSDEIKTRHFACDDDFFSLSFRRVLVFSGLGVYELVVAMFRRVTLSFFFFLFSYEEMNVYHPHCSHLFLCLEVFSVCACVFDFLLFSVCVHRVRMN